MYNNCAKGFIYMCEITATELKTHFGKYMDIAQKEEILVTHRGKPIFTIVPKREDLKRRWESYFGCLPKEAVDDNEIDRE